MANKVTKRVLITIIEFAGVIAVGSIVLGLSVMLFPLLIWPSLIGLIAIAIAEKLKKLPKRATLVGLSVFGLLLIVPVFAIAPIVIVTRPLFYGIVPQSIIIFDGISLSSTYDFFFSFPEMKLVDHPFPPITDRQYWIMIATTISISVPAAHFIHKVYRKERSARPV
jgi:hypothetical protein